MSVHHTGNMLRVVSRFCSFMSQIFQLHPVQKKQRKNHRRHVLIFLVILSQQEAVLNLHQVPSAFVRVASSYWKMVLHVSVSSTFRIHEGATEKCQ